MLWHSTTMIEPSLPAYCEPTNDFLLQFSALFHTCIPTPLAFLSNTLGILSITAWLFSQLPQIYKNWKLSSTSGLSVFFLLEWFLGDLSNLLGATFLHQASWQIIIGSYYVFVDLCLVGQWLWYEKLRRGKRPLSAGQTDRGSDDWSGGGMREIGMEGVHPSGLLGRDSFEQRERTFLTPASSPSGLKGHEYTFSVSKDVNEDEGQDDKLSTSFAPKPRSTTIQRPRPPLPIPSRLQNATLLVACLAAVVRASPTTKPQQPPVAHVPSSGTTLELAGVILSWMSTLLYLGSRWPQLIKNWARKSTAGLSPQLFIAAFCGNLFYSLALLTNPKAWYDFEPHGGGGWVGPDGSKRISFITVALPFFLGAAGVLALDACVGIQFMLYGEGQKDVAATELERPSSWTWRRVRQRVRGFLPGTSEARYNEHEALLEDNNRSVEGYGTL